MNKKLIVISMVGIFLLTSIAGLPTSSIKTSGTEIKSIENEKLQDIKLEDDAFHKTNRFFHIETWYFDAVFTNNYSMAVVITVVQKGNFGHVLTGLYIYEDTELIYHPRTLHTLKQLSASEEKLDIKISDETIMKCDIDNDTGSWTYHVSEMFDDVSVNLNFVNTADGWKTNITGGWWLVSPRLNVTGYMILEGENISVSGEGYHDHNWFYISTPLMQKGWHFGNIAGDSLGITWANIMKNRFNAESIVVLNQKNGKPIEIDPEDVKITIIEYIFSHRERIPKKFTLEIENDRLHVNVDIETLNTNHVKLPLLNYWRYHLRIVGTITLDSVTEYIDNIGISELMRFF
jgi:hypothetical protein